MILNKKQGVISGFYVVLQCAGKYQERRETMQKDLAKRFGKKIWQKDLAVLLVWVWMLLAMPVTAAAEVPATPTGDGNLFFANGIPITISAQAPADGTVAEISGLNTGNNAYISWEENGKTMYVGVTDWTSVYGGADGRKKAVTVPSTNITMTGGRILELFGGNKGWEGAGGEASTVTGNVRMHVTGPTGPSTIRVHCYGGGEGNTTVQGKVTMYLENVTGDTNYAGGGGCNLDGEGEGPAVNEVEFTIVNSDFTAVFPGGTSGSRAEKVTLKATRCLIGYVYINGINGHAEETHVTLENCKITSELAAVNRGSLGTGTVEVRNCEVKGFYSGATITPFSTDSSGNGFSGVMGSIEWNLDADTTIQEAYLTPTVKKEKGALVSANLGTVTINKEGDPLEMELSPFHASRGNQALIAEEMTVDQGSTVTLNGVTVTMTKGQDNKCVLTNNGTIRLGENTTWTVSSEDATLHNAAGGQIQVGETAALHNEGTIQNDGAITVESGGQVNGTIEGNQPQGQLVPSISHDSDDSDDSDQDERYIITLYVGEGGKASRDAGKFSVREGRDVTITFTPDEGNVVSRLVVDGEEVEAADSYTFESLAEDHTIRVEFGKAAAAAELPSDSAVSNPPTGDGSRVGLGAAVLLAAAGVCALAAGKRK